MFFFGLVAVAGENDWRSRWQATLHMASKQLNKAGIATHKRKRRV